MSEASRAALCVSAGAASGVGAEHSFLDQLAKDLCDFDPLLRVCPAPRECIDTPLEYDLQITMRCVRCCRFRGNRRKMFGIEGWEMQ